VVVEAGSEKEPIVLHVHVHSTKAHTTATPEGRPQLTGALFDWRGHYDPVIRRHLARQQSRDRRFWRRVANLPVLRALTLFAAYLIFRIPRDG
jgi:hypothetical protein